MEFTLIRSDRKSVGIQVNTDLTITVRAPWHVSDNEIQRIIQKKEPWIQKHLTQMKERREEYEKSGRQPLTAEDIQKLAQQALEYIPKRVEYFSKIIGVTYGRITIRNQKTRWGSCSSKGNLNFNCLLMLTPSEVIDYVVVHELCHRKQMNHSKKFWAEVEKILPDYKESIKWLKLHLII